MKRANVINGTLLLIAVVASAGMTAAISKRSPQEQQPSSAGTIRDAAGEQVRVRDYARIVSTSTIADQVLIEIIEPERLLAVSAHTLRSQESRPYQDKIGVEHARDIETIMELRPDIVFINNENIQILLSTHFYYLPVYECRTPSKSSTKALY